MLHFGIRNHRLRSSTPCGTPQFAMKCHGLTIEERGGLLDTFSPFVLHCVGIRQLVVEYDATIL